MYIYFQPSLKPDDKLQASLVESLQKHHIEGTIETYADEKELSQKLQNMSSKAINTVVSIGAEQDFETLIGLAKLIPDEVAVGFLPISHARIAQKMGLKNWQDAIDVLAQRRISEVTVFSIGSRFFFDEIELQTSEVESELPLNITLNGQLTLRSPMAQIRIKNISSEQFRSKSPLQLQLYRQTTTQTNSTAILTELRTRLKPATHTPGARKIAQVHGKHFAIESANTITDTLGRSYGSQLKVGQNVKTLRLITKRNTQL